MPPPIQKNSWSFAVPLLPASVAVTRWGHYGTPLILFASAGAGSVSDPLGSITPDSFDTLVAVNFRGTVFTVQYLLPLMSDGASIILNGTTSATKGIPGAGVYSASKAAVRSLARTWAAELKDRGRTHPYPARDG